MIEERASSSFANCLYVQYTSTEQVFSKPMKVKIHKANICTNVLKIISHCESIDRRFSQRTESKVSERVV